MGYKSIRRKAYTAGKSGALASDEAARKKTLPNSLLMRVMEDPEAEKEAEQLSKGITAQTPSEIMREMGGRLSADFSDVRFHTDPVNAERSEALDARGWAQGRDIYFGRGGFDPSVAAHELVHTVQQRAVNGDVSQSMPMGAVQLLPKNKNDQTEEDELDPNVEIDANSDLNMMLAEIFNTPNGVKIYRAIESDLNKLIRKGAGRGYRRCSKADGIRFLTLAAEKDYTGKTLLANIMKRSSQTAHFARKRLFDYQEFIQFLSNRLRESDLEEAAMESNLMAGPPKFEHNQPKQRKRAYEMQVPGKDSKKIDFNPGNDPELAQVQEAIDHAANPQEAYAIFGRFTGNNSAKYINNVDIKTNLSELKTKLKNMARVVRDYPELQGQIGNMNVADPKKETFYMGAVGTFGGRTKASLHYNAYYDTKAGKKERDEKISQKGAGYFTGSSDFAGTHEMGHVLASTLVEADNDKQASWIQNAHLNESRIMKSVFSNPDIMPEDDFKNLRRYTARDVERLKSPKGVETAVEGAIHSRQNKLFSNGYTSRYGTETPGEFFAEAFRDVYANGDQAKKASIATVQEYEKRQKKLTTEKFFGKKRGVWRRFWNWLKM